MLNADHRWCNPKTYISCVEYPRKHYTGKTFPIIFLWSGESKVDLLNWMLSNHMRVNFVRSCPTNPERSAGVWPLSTPYKILIQNIQNFCRRKIKFRTFNILVYLETRNFCHQFSQIIANKHFQKPNSGKIMAEISRFQMYQNVQNFILRRNFFCTLWNNFL